MAQLIKRIIATELAPKPVAAYRYLMIINIIIN